MGNRIFVAAIAAIFFALAAVGTTILWGVTTYNKAISYENQFQAQLANREMMHDNMFKTISEKFSTAKLERETVSKMIDAVAQGRQGGAIFKSVQETNPTFDQSLFREVMATIEGKRNEFTRSQQTLAQLQKEHNDLLTHLFSSLIVGGRAPLTFLVVSSSATKETMTTGIDDKSPIINKEEAEKSKP